VVILVVQCVGLSPQGSPRTPTARIAATTPRLIVRILNTVF